MPHCLVPAWSLDAPLPSTCLKHWCPTAWYLPEALMPHCLVPAWSIDAPLPGTCLKHWCPTAWYLPEALMPHCLIPAWSIDDPMPGTCLTPWWPTAWYLPEALMTHCLVPASRCWGYQGSRIDDSIKCSQPTADVVRLELSLKIAWIFVMFPWSLEARALIWKCLPVWYIILRKLSLEHTNNLLWVLMSVVYCQWIHF